MSPPTETAPPNGRHCGPSENAVQTPRTSAPAPISLIDLRVDRFRTKPFPAEREQQHRNRESAEPGELQKQVGDVRARLPNEIQAAWRRYRQYSRTDRPDDMRRD